MKTYKRLSKAATLSLFAAGMLGVGGMAAIATQSFAQTPTVVSTTSSSQERGADSEVNAVLPTGGITEAKATAAVVAQYPALTIKHIRLEDENGTVVYSAKLSDKTEVKVDVMTGVITPETDAQEGVEHKDISMNQGSEVADTTETAETPGTEVNDGPNSPTDTETNDGPGGTTDVGEPKVQ